ncbi:MAG: hydantoinase B/oxoprolinase family protein [Armatimonadetes bacterium]|nr:hydantoinase B/oxoprolinase family protein [Armatimonadota bacterium]
MSNRFSPVTLEILWNRLLSIVNTAAASLYRSAFSPLIREGKDYGCILLDRQGRALVQSSGSAPSVICLSLSAVRFLEQFPPETLRPGDIIICNDPWICSGHLNDVHMLTPIFHRGRLAAMAACFAHWVDIGGRPLASENREVFEEGVRVPIIKIAEDGRLNDALMQMIAANLRNPDHTLGDFRAQLAANHAASREVVRLLDEYQMESLDDLATAIFARSEAAMGAAIDAIPDGIYRSQVGLDGYDAPLTLAVALRVAGNRLTVDYAGTSQQVNYALNSCMNFTYAYTVVPLKLVTAPRIPINSGLLRPLEVTAPPGTIVNPVPPVAVGQRVLVGHFLHAAIFRALAPVLPDRVQADSGSCPNWSSSWNSIGQPRDRSFAHMFFSHGGQGAFPHRDGNPCTPFPSNVGNTPVEIMERVCPVIVEHKELRQDSGGPGRFRGGCGQRITIRCLTDIPTQVTVRCDRVRHPEHVAKGVLGGWPGTVGRVLVNGTPAANPKAEFIFRSGDTLTLETPGGGGYGNPGERDRSRVEDDLRNGLLSANHAGQAYGFTQEPAAVTPAALGTEG